MYCNLVVVLTSCMKMYEDIPPFLLELMCGEAGIIEKNIHKWPTDMIVNSSGSTN